VETDVSNLKVRSSCSEQGSGSWDFYHKLTDYSIPKHWYLVPNSAQKWYFSCSCPGQVNPTTLYLPSSWRQLSY
jgi:hypothetical protein